MVETSDLRNRVDCTVYVGDLSTQTLESDLYRIFSSVGSILTIKLVKPPQTENIPNHNSAYAYIIFNQKSEADLAVEKLNFMRLHNKEMRVMLCDKEKLRKAHSANIVIKNLSPECDNKTLHDTFAIFGEILSCKVAQNSNMQCKGFGFVNFARKSSAKKALAVGSGMLMDGIPIKVERYSDNHKKNSNVSFTNIFFKNFPQDAEEKIKNLFSKYGEVTSFYFAKKSDGTLKGFGFANFSNPEEAKMAIENLHDQDIFKDEYPELFYVQQAQKKQERVDSLSAAFEKMTINGMTLKRNLYVTRLPKDFQEEDVKNLMSQFGKIISVVVGTDRASSEEKKWAYVCYSSPEEATTAFEKGNELFVENQRIIISYFKSKQERDHEIMTDNVQRFSFKNNLRNIQIPKPLIFKSQIKHQKKVFDKKQIRGDLYGLVLSLAPTFFPKWKNLGIKDNEEFASKITEMLLKKSSTDVRNMIALGNVLTQNISDMLNGFSEFEGEEQ